MASQSWWPDLSFSLLLPGHGRDQGVSPRTRAVAEIPRSGDRNDHHQGWQVSPIGLEERQGRGSEKQRRKVGLEKKREGKGGSGRRAQRTRGQRALGDILFDLFLIIEGCAVDPIFF